MSRATRRQFSAEEKIRIVLDGLRGVHSIVELCRREVIAESLYYTWSKEFLEAGKRRRAGDTARSATTDEVKTLRREGQEDLKEVVAEQALELRLLKKSMIGGRVPSEGMLTTGDKRGLIRVAFTSRWLSHGAHALRRQLLLRASAVARPR